MSKEVQPGYAEIISRSRRLANASRHVVFEEIGPSEQGRPIPGLTLGDPGRDLPLIMVTGGTHGCEEVGRATAMAFAEWLAGPGARWLKKMSAIVVPCVSPDGSIANSYHNAKDVNIYHSYGFGKTATTAEGRAVEAVAMALLPDCCVDCHGLAGGGMGSCEYLHPRLPGSMGLQFSYAVAAEMDAAANKAGFPQQHPPMEGKFRNEKGPLCDKLASETNALCFTLETTEHYYPLADAVHSGLTRLQKLVEIGTRTDFNQPYPGFPCDTITGGQMWALMAFGTTYRQRRLSRPLTIAPILESMTNYMRQGADRGRAATITLDFEKEAKTFPEGVVFQAALDPRCRIKGVTFEWPDGTRGKVPPGEGAFGYVVWQEHGNGIPLVRVSIDRPPTNGANTVRIAYSAPFKAHDPFTKG